MTRACINPAWITSSAHFWLCSGQQVAWCNAMSIDRFIGEDCAAVRKPGNGFADEENVLLTPL